ncbi:MAG TPA: tRNA (N6-threonylcarbamoyladenosine(37)-N6)-methyltransferase TrmO [Gammaproteobacteria bacterium]|nr:tRNA (N6-threonylcarbamoyladenosine(37)-N6)-methyltransferase TrmO [Gammaproteobacteria bacterium]
MQEATIRFIGHISTPYITLKDCPHQPQPDAERSLITLDDAYLPALKGIEKLRYLHVLYWFDQSARDVLQRIPPKDPNAGSRGVFALRSPVRPNPIAVSVVELFDVNGNQLTISSLDCLNGTPLVDIKAYVDQLAAHQNPQQRTACPFHSKGTR